MWSTLKTWIGDVADTIPADAVAGQFRHLIGGAGWVAAVNGLVGADLTQYVIGIAAALVAHSWSWLQKLNDPNVSA